MTGKNLERRVFLKICGAAVTGSVLTGVPSRLLANDSSKKKNVRFKLYKSRWIIYENGSFDLIGKEISLINCRPAVNGQTVMPKNVFLGDSPKGKRIVYELQDGFLMLDLKTNKDSLSIGAELSGFSEAPKWFYPISQAEVHGAKHFYTQSFGTGGQSGVYNIISPRPETNWSCDSYMIFAFLGEEETIAIGNVDYNDFLQRSGIYNRSHRAVLLNKEAEEEQVFFESAMLLDEIRIKNEYIKLPELHFFTGNKPFETLQEITWYTGEVSAARQGSVTSFHWVNCRQHKSANTFDNLKNQIDYLGSLNPPLPLHTLVVGQGYCITGDWLEPNGNWPGGLDRAAREIFKDGYRAGIWLAPFAVAEKSRLYSQHPEWVINDDNEKPVVELTTNEGNIFALDPKIPGVQRYIERVFRTLRKSGFIFYETAFMDWGLKHSAVSYPNNSNFSGLRDFRDILQLIRNEIGPGSLWSMDQTAFASVIGFADIVNTNHPVSNGWNQDGIENMIQESFFSHFFNNIYWQNNPGEISLINANKNFTDGEITSLALWMGMLGGSVGICDNLTELDSKTLDFVRFLEPNKRPSNASLPFWPDPEEIKVAVRTYKQQKSWGVLFFNDKNIPVSRTYSVTDLTGDESAHVFSWKPEIPAYYGKLSEISVALEPHHSRLFYFSENEEWPPENLTLGGKLQENP